MYHLYGRICRGVHFISTKMLRIKGRFYHKSDKLANEMNDQGIVYQNFKCYYPFGRVLVRGQGHIFLYSKTIICILLLPEICTYFVMKICFISLILILGLEWNKQWDNRHYCSWYWINWFWPKGHRHRWINKENPKGYRNNPDRIAVLSKPQR